MEDINGNEINEAQEIGTRKYILKINNRYLVDFRETESKRGKGAYSNPAEIITLHAMYDANILIVSNKKEEAQVFEGRMNLTSVIDKILKNWGYKFYHIEIIEIE